jgi:hypothetical protein
MTKMLNVTEYELKTYTGYLDSLWEEYNGKTGEQPFSITKLETGGYVFDLDEEFEEFAKDTDHDCRTPQGQGCSFCYFLQEIGVLPDYDYYPDDRDDVEPEDEGGHPNSEYLAGKAEEIRDAMRENGDPRGYQKGGDNNDGKIS